MNELPRLFIIDAMAMAFRTFYAMNRAGLTTQDGFPVSALYGTSLFLHKLIREQRPDYLVMAGDSQKATFRHQLYPEYKAHRSAMPDDLRVQLPAFWLLLEQFQVPVLRREGFEADDIIGTLVRLYKNQAQIHIVSGDKDFLQLIDQNVFLFSPKKNQPAEVVGVSEFKDLWGVSPPEFVDCLALMGDKSDNIPGVSGVGPKGAQTLIKKYHSLEGIYQNLEEIKSEKMRRHLDQDREHAFLSRRLATIDQNVPLQVSFEDMALDWQRIEADQKLQTFYDRYGFKSLLKSSLGERTQSSATTPSAGELSMDNDLAGDKVPMLAGEKAWLAVSGFDPLASVFMVVEGKQSSPVAGVITRILLTVEGDSGHNYCLDWNDSKVQQLLHPMLTDQQRVFLGIDLKASWQLFASHGLKVRASFRDLQIMDYLLDPGVRDRDLASMCQRYLVNDRRHLGPEILPTDYFELNRKLQTMIMNQGLERVFELECQLLPVLAEMERRGIYLDAEQLAKFSFELKAAEDQLTEDIYALAGEPFNIQSSKQLQYILFEKLKIQDQLGIKRLKKTKTGWSTDEEVLTQLAEHPIANKILSFREVAKLKSTYVDTLPQHINPASGRIHSQFNQMVAATGRLSSDKPNLQNIPVMTPLGQRVRQAFQPRDHSWLFLAADYSQIEIRLLAGFAKAQHLIDSFKAGHDIHRSTAAKIFNKKLDEVDDTLRSRAKAVNFGILYGMGPQRLAKETGVTVPQAKEFINRYFDSFPEIKDYLDQLKELARLKGYSETILGRRRPIAGLNDANKQIVARAESIAVNSPIQGSAADLIKMAMVAIQRELDQKSLEGGMILQIHDELVFELPQHELDSFVGMVRHHMESALTLAVPLKVDMKVGPDWLNLSFNRP